MGYEISHLHDPRGLCISFEGVVPSATLLEALREMGTIMHGDGVAEPVHVLWDARGLKAVVADPADLPALDEAVREFRNRLGAGRSAVVFGQGEIDAYLFTQLLLARAPKGNREQAMFRDYDPAIAWLKEGGGRPPPAERFAETTDPSRSS